MAIPAIAPYPLPAVHDLPENRAGWRAEADRSVLLIHDMQRYFLDAYVADEPPIVDVIANIRALRDACDRQGIPVVYTAQPGGQAPADRGLLTDFWGTGIGEGPDEESIVDELAPGHRDTVFTKWRYSAFQRTELSRFLRERGRDQLIITGIYAHIGCLMTACEAFMRDVQSFLVADAVADFSLDDHRMALRYAARRCAVTLSSRRQLDHLLDVPAAHTQQIGS